MLLSTALEICKTRPFTVTFVTHDEGRKKGGELRTMTDVVILGSKIWWELYQLSFTDTTRNPTPLEKKSMEEYTKKTTPSIPRDHINVASVVSGLLDSTFPTKICIHLITAINGEEITI